ncbi:hypothetical protein LI177_02805 [bacterium 210820-DFI.6.37]|nr:hypothetical protein [bacterium 210820-DFI.6.37]
MKKKKTRRPKVELSEKQILKIKQGVAKEATEKACLLAVAVMADTLSLTEDEICKVASDISRWAEYVDKHIVKINDVADVIESKTGIKFGRF